MIIPRDFQSAGVASVIAHHREHQAVLGRAATGLGKALILSMLAQHYTQFGRVLILVDVANLVRQLAEEVERYTGIAPGIEMADEYAVNGGPAAGQLYDNHDRIIVSTVQTQYSGPEGDERYRRFDPNEFAVILLDECETFFPNNKSRSVVEWYRTNPKCKIAGVTATPFRTDGTAAANLFTAVAFDHDIIWGIDNGWLVPVRQAFVKTSIDMSTIRLRCGKDGTQDYSESDIAKTISTEPHLIEIAKGILATVGTMKTIVVCPAGKDELGSAAVARAVAHYLDAQKPGSARCIYGELGDDEKGDIFKAFEADQFQILTSVSMLTKGFNSPGVQAVCNCRRTRSKRMFQQIMGRGTRPLKGVVDGLTTADERKAAIAASAKPHMLMVNIVGVDDWVRDMTVIDILGEVEDEQVIERAKKIAAEEGKDAKESIAEAQLQIEYEQDELRRQAEEAQAELEQEEMHRLQQGIRSAFDVEVKTEVEYSDDLRVGDGRSSSGEVDANERRKSTLRRFKYPDNVIDNLPEERLKHLSGRVIARANKGMVASYPQIQFLRKLGATNEQINGMSKADADVFIKSKTGKRDVA